MTAPSGPLGLSPTIFETLTIVAGTFRLSGFVVTILETLNFVAGTFETL